MSQVTYDTDVAIIGAGSAGLAALAEVQKTTDRVTLIEAGPLGTMCARTGCMPSKALLEWTRDPAGPAHQSPFARTRELRDYFVAAAVRQTEARATHLVREKATFISPHQLRIGGRTLSARAIIIATGSTPIFPEAWRTLGDRVLTTDTFFEQPAPPKSCAVIGTGPIGLELGQALRRLGVEVTVYGRDRLVAGLSDQAVSEAAIGLFERDLKLQFGAAVGPDNIDPACERILLCVGRRPNVADLGLENLGVALGPDGVPEFDPVTRRVGQTSIFIAGDVAGDRPIQHEAVYQGRTAGFHATRGGPNPYAPYPRFHVAFTRPNIAVVGETGACVDDARVVTGHVDYADQGRARVMGAAGGLLRVYADRADGRLRGAEMVCPAGEHLAHLLVLAITHRMTVDDVLKMPFYHPTLEEGLRTALVRLRNKIKSGEKDGLSP